MEERDSARPVAASDLLSPSDHAAGTENELEALFQLSLDMLCIAGRDGYLKRVNPAFERTLGHATEEFLSRPFLEFVHPEDREKTRHELRRLVRNQPTIQFENRWCCRDGSHRWLSWTAVPADRAERIYAVASDVTERKRVEERFCQLVESAPDGLVLVDGAGQIVLVNSRLEELSQYSRDELIGQSVELLVPAPDRDRHQRDRIGYSACPRSRLMGEHPELCFRRKDGSEFRAEISLSPIGTEEGTLTCAAVRDITARMLAEAKAREHEAQFLAARRIQEYLLPRRAPVLAGFDIAGWSYPAEFTSGDIFDFLTMRHGSLGLAIGDVTGHGFAPALLMASTHAYLRLLVQTNDDVGRVLGVVNAMLVEETEGDRFVTLLLGCLDPGSRSFVYCNAGHPAGYVLDAQGNVKSMLESTTMPLGVIAEWDVSPSTTSRILLEPGDLLLLITDGLLEAQSPDEDPFGAERVLRVVRDHPRHSSRELIEALYRAVLDFSGAEAPLDDVTIIVIRVDARGDGAADKAPGCAPD